MKKIICLAIIFFGISLSNSVFAYTSPGSYTGFVNDFAGILSLETKNQLEVKLSDFEKTESNEIAVVTIKSLDNDTIENYAEKLFQEWGIGKAKQDNGILLLIAPNDRQVRIEVGYGLEGALTDLESGQIIRNILVPAFQSNEFDNGVIGAVDAIKLATKGEYVPVESTSSNGKNIIKFLIFFFFFIFLDIVFWFARKMANSQAIWPGGIGGGIIGAILSLGSFLVLSTSLWFILPSIFICGVLGLFFDYILSRTKLSEKVKKMSQDNNGPRMWGGLGGGGSGGGFGGFGGGSSGGGGASGRW